ncbi:hypothetical protein BT69DRAFT_1235840 [Atractiella rhizophila]|nr:hypothetical protein BT69DRAFT_1235840 [Atractiella rhizophila]
MSSPLQLPEWFGRVPPAIPKRLPLLQSDPPLYVPGSLSPSSDVSPRICEGWKDTFTQRAKVWSLKVDAKSTGKWRQILEQRKMLLSIPSTQVIYADPTDDTKRLLRTQYLASPIETSSPSTTEDRVPQPAINDQELPDGVHFVPTEIELGYDHWQSEQILQALLPEELLSETPASFTIVGDIVHLNLREQYLPYRYLIGQIILDHAPYARIVVNKIGEIEHQFRFFDMEVLARKGPARTTPSEFSVTLNYNTTVLSFDFSKVYFNTRLHTEHLRLLMLYLSPANAHQLTSNVKKLQAGFPKVQEEWKKATGEEVVADVMAGVGPFAIPAAKTGKFVLANDLNFHSYEACAENAKMNKVQNFARCFNLDGREFIRQSVQNVWRDPFPTPPPPQPKKGKPEFIAAPPPPPRHVSNYILNLPSTALEFLDAFRGLLVPALEEAAWKQLYEEKGMPLVHVYCFTRCEGDEEIKADIEGRACEAMRCERGDLGVTECFWVRKVAPRKEMYCLTFRLPEKVAFAKG